MEHALNQILTFEDFNLHTIFEWYLKGKQIKVVESPKDLLPDRYHTKCQRTCVLYGSCICDKVRCIGWQRKDGLNIVYQFINNG